MVEYKTLQMMRMEYPPNAFFQFIAYKLIFFHTAIFHLFPF